ncbi:cysteine desulfurase family protein [Rurimicrobium arvi]|uniref:cysteine desulfurase n=1 Tax=Rurimicrobium arvi TaxID=2049916 RepID=A0ABP8MYY3_9BACT
MTRIYFDNAATTALDSEVLEAMMPYLTEKFGNPSSVYSYGRETKMAIENARKQVAKHLGVTPGEIFFTSGGTESSNTAITTAVRDLGCDHIITSPLEHHATLHCAEEVARDRNIPLHYVQVLPNGHIDLEHLTGLLRDHKGKTLVTLMHANNEIGNLLDVAAVGNLCEQYGAVFHCDMVQTIGHYPMNLPALKVHFASAAGHKFHGPKGVGVLYVNAHIQVKPMIHGGAQERNMRAGTENLYGIVGFAKALDMAMAKHEEDKQYILDLKTYMHDQLKSAFPDIRTNGDTFGDCLYTVLNISFPKNEKSEMLLFNLDMAGICVSGGSACSSGSTSVSHVIKCLYNGQSEFMVPIRFSFSKHNKKEEVDAVISKLKDLIA